MSIVIDENEHTSYGNDVLKYMVHDIYFPNAHSGQRNCELYINIIEYCIMWNMLVPYSKHMLLNNVTNCTEFVECDSLVLDTGQRQVAVVNTVTV